MTVFDNCRLLICPTAEEIILKSYKAKIGEYIFPYMNVSYLSNTSDIYWCIQGIRLATVLVTVLACEYETFWSRRVCVCTCVYWSHRVYFPQQMSRVEQHSKLASMLTDRSTCTENMRDMQTHTHTHIQTLSVHLKQLNKIKQVQFRGECAYAGVIESNLILAAHIFHEVYAKPPSERKITNAIS